MKYFPFKEAIKFPFFISRNVKLVKLHGKVHICGRVKTGMVRFGYGYVGIYNRQDTHAVWCNEGDVYIKGDAFIKFGAKIDVNKGAVLEIGEGFRMSCNSCIVCTKKITIGNSTRISWEVMIIDSDFHKILDSNDRKRINPDKPIVIGDNVWIGMYVKVLKGSVIGNGNIIGAGTKISTTVDEKNSIIVEQSALKVVKDNVTWQG